VGALVTRRADTRAGLIRSFVRGGG